ncbi:hypothetical protein ACFFWD_07645 [Bradyrhizobium erythrophlei]|uniref:hypothetical protein n=1 Tax=Bradyrhizobium erythrophlei TaxID=1437360 RepID=UPI0035E99BFD
MTNLARQQNHKFKLKAYVDAASRGMVEGRSQSADPVVASNTDENAAIFNLANISTVACRIIGERDRRHRIDIRAANAACCLSLDEGALPHFRRARGAALGAEGNEYGHSVWGRVFRLHEERSPQFG